MAQVYGAMMINAGLSRDKNTNKYSKNFKIISTD